MSLKSENVTATGITVTLVNHGRLQAYGCGKGQIALSSVCVKPPHDVA